MEEEAALQISDDDFAARFQNSYSRVERLFWIVHIKECKKDANATEGCVVDHRERLSVRLDHGEPLANLGRRAQAWSEAWRASPGCCRPR